MKERRRKARDVQSKEVSKEKAREFQKNTYFCFIDYAKAFDCVDHNKLWNWTWNNRLVPNRERSTSRLYIVTLLI